MNRVYIARRTRTNAAGEKILLSSTSIYATSELEAKVAAAEQLGCDPDDVQIAVLPDISNPTDAELEAGR